MSTEMKPTTNFTLTQFWGGDDRGRCLQVTDTTGIEPDFVQLTKEDAIELAIALIEWTNDRRDGAFSVDNPRDLI